MQDVLFLGNGINRAFNGDSWDNLIKKISTKYESSLTADDVEHLPFPMKVVALSGDRVIATVKHNTFLQLRSERIQLLYCNRYS